MRIGTGAKEGNAEALVGHPIAMGLGSPFDQTGLEATLPQGGQVMQPFADAEIVRVVEGGFGPQPAALLFDNPLADPGG